MCTYLWIIAYLAAVATALVTPVANETCICVPTGSCNGTNTPSSPPPSPSTNLTTSPPPITTCTTGLQLCCQPGPPQCGVRYPPVAGSPVPTAGQATYGEYPWHAALISSPFNVYVGSGVLIDNWHVLTVAHAIAQYVILPGNLKVRMGEWDSAAATEPIMPQEFIVRRYFVMPTYNAANFKNDVAILRLATAVPLGNTPTIGTGCLPSKSFTGTRCWVSGWGPNVFVNGAFQNIQKEVDVSILQNLECQTRLRLTRLGPTFVFDTASFLCAGGEAGKDACTVGGGSPLMCNIADRWFIAGLYSWGIGCGTTNFPGVYVNVLSFVGWIQSCTSSP